MMENKLPQIVFATNNPHKLEEARNILKDKVEILSLSDIGCHDDIEETSETLEGNSLIKARWVKNKYGYDCFADDTGLMVEALDGAPGVYSARYAGEHCSPADNIALLLKKMKGISNRKAKFATVVALISGTEEFLFEGEVSGRIAEENSGNAGFGYDPVFIPSRKEVEELIGKGFYKHDEDVKDKSFAEMSAEAKNEISHRGRAMRKLADFLSLKSR